MFNAEQFAAAQKAQFGTLFALSGKALEGAEKLAQLNLATGKAALTEVTSQMQAALAVKTPQELFSLQSTQLKPGAEKLVAYGREVYAIGTDVGAEFAKAAQSQLVEANARLTAALDAALKNAPAGSEPAVAAIKSAVASSETALESVQKAVKQATDMAEANLKAVMGAATAV